MNDMSTFSLKFVNIFYNLLRLEKNNQQKPWDLDQMLGHQLNAPGVHLKIGSLDPAFFFFWRPPCNIGVQCLIKKIWY